MALSRKHAAPIFFLPPLLHRVNSLRSTTRISTSPPMAFAHHPISILLKTSKHPKTSILKSPLPLPPSFSSISLPLKPRNLSLLLRSRIPGHKGNYSSPPSAQVEPQEYQASSAADAFTNFKASSAAHHRWEPISLRGHETGYSYCCCFGEEVWV